MSIRSFDNQNLSQRPSTFTKDNTKLKSVELKDLLQNAINKINSDPQFLNDQQSKEVDLLIAATQLFLVPSSTSCDNKQDLLNSIIILGQDLLSNERLTNLSEEIPILMDSSPQKNEDKIVIGVISSPISDDTSIINFSLADLACEYLTNEPTTTCSTNEYPQRSAEVAESDLTLDSLSKSFLSLSTSSSTSSPNVLTKLCPSSQLSNESIRIQSPPLDSILFCSRLTSQEAADDADSIWKHESSRFGQIFCTKSNSIPIIPTKRVSTCLFDRNLYERLTHLIMLLPKQCIKNSISQNLPNVNQASHFRPQRSNQDNNKRYGHRPGFQQNALQANFVARFPTGQNPRPYANFNSTYQQENVNRNFVDRRQPQQQNRHSSTSSSTSAQSIDQQQQKRQKKHNVDSNEQRFQAVNSQTRQDYHNQRGSKRPRGGGGGGGGNSSNWQ